MSGAQQRHLVDAYCHGVLQGDLGLGAFEARLPGAAAPYTTLFDSPTGFAVRRWCPPLLGLEPHCPPARYLARRRELGAYGVARILLRGTGITAYLVDAGEPGDLTPPRELGAAGAAPAYEVVRLEPLAQQVADTSGTVDGFLANLAAAVRGAASSAAGFSCGDGAPDGLRGRHAGPAAPVRHRTAAPQPWCPGCGRPRPGHARAACPQCGDRGGPADGYGAGPPGPGPARPFPAAAGPPPGGGPGGGRHAGPGRGGAEAEDGLARQTGLGARPPGPHEVRRAAARWLAGRPAGGRLTCPVLRGHLVWQAVATGLPLTLRHAQGGPGPRAAEDFLRATAGLGTDLVLLPGAAHQQAAADLATVLPHVYVAVADDPAAVLARTPFGKVLYASAAVALPELYVTGARRFLAGLDRAVGERVAAGEWSAADGQRVAALVAEGNARRVHRLPDTAAGRVPHPRFPYADTLR